jgi:hypothetical protein
MVSFLANKASAHFFGKISAYIEISNTFNTWEVATALIGWRKN